MPDAARTSGSVRFDGTELLGLDDAAMGRLRGRRIGMVFQEPMTALNPLHTIGRQVAEPLRLHKGLSADAARAEALRLLDQVRLPSAAQRLDAHPHQLSGGQRQRVVIAMALACGPDLLIADEPTTALDVTIQGEILDLIGDLVEARGMALLLVSHDLGVMARTVDRLLVMYGGSVVEAGPTAAVFEHLAHPYTRGLFGARPRLGAPRGTPPRDDSGPRARADRPAARLPVRRPLRLGRRRLPCRAAAAGRGRAGPHGALHPPRRDRRRRAAASGRARRSRRRHERHAGRSRPRRRSRARRSRHADVAAAGAAPTSTSPTCRC